MFHGAIPFAQVKGFAVLFILHKSSMNTVAKEKAEIALRFFFDLRDKRA